MLGESMLRRVVGTTLVAALSERAIAACAVSEIRSYSLPAATSGTIALPIKFNGMIFTANRNEHVRCGGGADHCANIVLGRLRFIPRSCGETGSG